MNDGRGDEVLARANACAIAGAAYMAAVAKFPNRNIALRHGAGH